MGSLTKAAAEETVVATAEEEDWSDEAVVYVNGVRRVLPDGLAHLTLFQYLRDIGLRGTKLGCGEGGCGACTVMVSCYDRTTKKSLHFAINACLALLYSVEGMHIITVEGIGDRPRGLHPVQAHRREDDIALVNAGMRVYLSGAAGDQIISDVSIVYGGVAAVPRSTPKTEEFLTGKKWDSGLLDDIFNLLKEDIPISENAPGGMVEFRRSLTLSFFSKFSILLLMK